MKEVSLLLNTHRGNTNYSLTGKYPTNPAHEIGLTSIILKKNWYQILNTQFIDIAIESGSEDFLSSMSLLSAGPYQSVEEIITIINEKMKFSLMVLYDKHPEIPIPPKFELKNKRIIVVRGKYLDFKLIPVVSMELLMILGLTKKFYKSFSKTDDDLAKKYFDINYNEQLDYCDTHCDANLNSGKDVIYLGCSWKLLQNEAWHEGGDIIKAIPVAKYKSGEVISEFYKFPEYFYLKPGEFTAIRLDLRDKYGRSLKFHNNSMTTSLTLRHKF